MTRTYTSKSRANSLQISIQALQTIADVPDDLDVRFFGVRSVHITAVISAAFANFLTCFPWPIPTTICVKAFTL